MNIKEIKSKTKAELSRELLESQTELRQLRFELASGRVKNLKAMRQARKTIARILTVLNNQKIKKD